MLILIIYFTQDRQLTYIITVNSSKDNGNKSYSVKLNLFLINGKRERMVEKIKDRNRAWKKVIKGKWEKNQNTRVNDRSKKSNEYANTPS